MEYFCLSSTEPQISVLGLTGCVIKMPVDSIYLCTLVLGCHFSERSWQACSLVLL